MTKWPPLQPLINDSVRCSRLSVGDQLKLDRLEAMLASHRAAFNEIISIAETYPDNTSLHQLRARAERGIAAIDIERQCPTFGTHGSLGLWGENGHAPLIEHMLWKARMMERLLCN